MLPPGEAVKFFLSCCGSVRWAEHMAECRPFWTVQVVYNAAGTIWGYLSPEDQREALRARAAWNEDTLPEPLVEALNLYERKFGYGFSAGPQESAHDAILSAVRRRLEYSPAAEFDIAVREEARKMNAEVLKRIAG